MIAQLSSGTTRLVHREAHQRVAVCGREVDAVEQFFDGEPVELRGHLRAAAEDSLDAGLLERDLFARALRAAWAW